MRVIVVSDSARISGGAEKVALTSAIALAEAGVEVHAFCGTGPLDDRLNGVENLNVTLTGHLPFYENPNKVQGVRQILWNRGAREAFESLLAAYDPKDTIVHFHCYLRVHSASVLDAALDLGFPVVVTLHDYGLACPNMGFYNYLTREVCTLSPMSVECVRTQCTVKGRLNKLGFVARGVVLQTAVRWNRRIRHFVAVSGISGEIMRPFLAKDAEIHRLLNPVDVEQSDPVDVASNDRLLFVGKLDHQKDPVRLAQAAKSVGMPVTFVGDGPLMDEVKASNPEALITGWVTPAEVRAHQRTARALVMTSRWYEAAPLVIFDALAAGLPVVVPDICAGREFIEHGKTGFIYDSKKSDGLESVLEQLKDGAAARMMGREAYNRFWQDPPTMAKHVENLKRLYAQVLKHP